VEVQSTYMDVLTKYAAKHLVVDHIHM